MSKIEGHTILSHRPTSKRTRVIFVSTDENGAPQYRWDGEWSYHKSQADAYEAEGLPRNQAPDYEKPIHT